jgi:hypothetical protein
MHRRISWSALVVVLMVAVAIPAGAQTAAPATDVPAPVGAPPVLEAPVPPPPPAAIPSPVAPVSGAIAPSAGSLKLEGTTKGTSIRFGMILQPQYQAVSSPSAALDGYSQNLFIRRTRLLIGGSLFGTIDYFFLTDFVNLFLPTPVTGAMGAPNTNLKSTPGMNIQDIFITYRAIGDMLKVDVGYMLPPLSHNSLQGAGTLLGWDYFAYAFLHGGAPIFQASGNPVGRDVGAQLRGLVFDGRIDYRVGLFQGVRSPQTATEVASKNFFRMAARLQVNLLDPETAFFYQGTYLGAKKILSFGGSYDFQDSYKSFSVDAVADLPIGPGVFSGQAAYVYWDGNTFIPSFPKRKAAFGEVGYTFAGSRLCPIFRLEHLWAPAAVAPATTPNETRYAGGLAWFAYGHTSNLKAFYTRIQTEGAARGANQINIQWQVYFF